MNDIVYMGWFDNSSVTLETKVKQGAKVYEMKHRIRPNVCLVHTSQLAAETMIQDVRVTPTTGVLPFDFYFAKVDSDKPQPL
jgi:hypothetical protein